MSFSTTRFEIEGEILEGEALTEYVGQNKDAIAAFYEKNKERFVRARETKVRRVLVKKPKDAKKEELEAARNKAEALLADAKAEAQTLQPSLQSHRRLLQGQQVTWVGKVRATHPGIMRFMKS